jgi:hypothetical protein
MSKSDGGSPANTLRVAANSPRSIVVAIVGGLSALGGAVAGGVAALIAAAVLTPSEPLSAAQVAQMAVEYGLLTGVGGSVLGTIVAFGALRRVPLGRLILATNVGLAAGLTAGWLGGPWAWHHIGLLGFIGFSSGAVLARAVSRGGRVPSSSLPFDSVPASRTMASEPPEVVRALTSPVELFAPVDRTADRVRRGVPPEA